MDFWIKAIADVLGEAAPFGVLVAIATIGEEVRKRKAFHEYELERLRYSRRRMRAIRR